MKRNIKDLLIANKRLFVIYLISILTQITIFLIIHGFNWISQEHISSPWFMFLMNTLEPYSDYTYWYQGIGKQFLNEGWVPYIGALNEIPEYQNIIDYLLNIIFSGGTLPFIYPPFFFYSIIIPALININLVFLPLIVANNLLPFIIYKLLHNFYGKKIAEWGFIASTICPLSIFYSGGLVLNTSLVTLFFVIALYFVSINQFTKSIIFLSIALLFKQIVIFFVLPFIVYIVLQTTKNNRSRLIIDYSKNFLKYFGILILTLFLGSLPWIIIDPKNYINILLVDQAITFSPEFPIPRYNYPMQWYSFIIKFNAPYWLLFILAFLTFTFLGIIIMEIVSVILFFKWNSKNKLDWIKLLDIIVYTSFITHLFFPRGVYKYYFTFHVPLLILWICFHFKEVLSSDNAMQRNWILLFIVISFGILIMPRFYYLFIFWVIFIIIVRTNLNHNKRKIQLPV